MGVRRRRLRRRSTVGVAAPGAPVESVRQWASRHRAPSTRLVAASEVDLQPPRTVEPDLLPTYDRHRRLHLLDRHLSCVPGARLLGRDALVADADGVLVAVHEVAKVTTVEAASEAQRSSTAVVRRSGDHFSLVPAWPDAHYHLLHDAFARLPGVLAHLPAATWFVVSDLTPASHRDALRAFGIPGDRIVVRPSHEIWEVERLHVVSPAAFAGHDRSDLDREVRDAVMAHFGVGFAPPARRLFVSRRGQRRRAVNEDEVMEVLVPLGFESVEPERLSLRDQVALFAEAEVVLSNHGSAFTNILFAPPGLRLVDAVDPQVHHCAHVFWSMCEALGHEYWYFEAERFPAPHRDRDDVRIPLDRLVATLAAMGLERSGGSGGPATAWVERHSRSGTDAPMTICDDGDRRDRWKPGGSAPA